MEDIVNIVKREIIDKMKFELEIEDVSTVFITVCNLKWARIGGFVKDENDVSYKIISIDYVLNVIEVETAFLGTQIFIKVPLYFYGTPIEVNSEWGAITKIEKDKIPFIWLVLPSREIPFGRESALSKESELRIIFADNRLVTNWKVKDIHLNRTQAMINMVDEFKRVIEDNTKFKPVLDYVTRVLDKLGSESEKGYVNNIIDANLTAIELRLTLPIYKGIICNC